MNSGDLKRKSVFDVPMTYSGLLDDVVYRHKITPEVDGDFFNRSIIRNVFFSGRIFINDGYLVNHPSALQQLRNESSLLRVMVKNDFVRVLARQQDADAFANNPEEMAKRGVESFSRLVAQPDWPEIKDSLRRWSDGLYAYNKIDGWPGYQMHAGFRKLFQRIFDKTLDDLGLSQYPGLNLEIFRERYERHPGYLTAPRTAVEEVAMGMVSEGLFAPSGLPAIMDIANQCYHYNFAMCLSSDCGKPVVADTTIGKAFEDILDLDDIVEAELEQVPVLAIPRGFPIDNGAIFDRLMDPQSDLAHAKHTFLSEVDATFKRTGNESPAERVRSLKDAAERYRSYLKEHFSGLIGISDWAPRRGALITYGIGKIGSVFAADNIMLAANLASSRRVSSFIHRMTKPITKRALDVALNPDSGEEKLMTFTVGEVRPRFASLAFDRKAISAHVSDLPKV